METVDIKRFLDNDGKIKIWPSKMEMKMAVLHYLSEKFDYGTDYTQREVNEIINEWHTFGDYFLLRRGMIDAHYLCRTANGSRYWRENK